MLSQFYCLLFTCLINSTLILCKEAQKVFGTLTVLSRHQVKKLTCKVLSAVS